MKWYYDTKIARPITITKRPDDHDLEYESSPSGGGTAFAGLFVAILIFLIVGML